MRIGGDFCSEAKLRRTVAIGSQAKPARTVADYKTNDIMRDRERVIEFVRRVIAERTVNNIEPRNVPYIFIIREFGDGVGAILDALCESGELVRCETINSYSYNLKEI